jgi:hypothetical protein
MNGVTILSPSSAMKWSRLFEAGLMLQRLTRRAILHGENRFMRSISKLRVRAVLQKKLALEVVFLKRFTAEAVCKGGKEHRC